MDTLWFGDACHGVYKAELTSDWVKSTTPSKESSKVEGSANSDHVSTQLCDLPDEVLHNILGLLPIKKAIKTCVLSRRWQNLWRSMPHLVFKRDYKVMTRSSFLKLIDRVCTLRNPNHSIHKFELHYDPDSDDAPLINGFIATAIKGRVQDLSLDLCTYGEPYSLPYCIFSSETLVKFHLSLSIWCTLELRDCITLPRLKVLHLRTIKFADAKSIEKLFSCPLLEELHIKRCCLDNNYTNNGYVVNVSAPNLRRLVIKSDGREVLPPLWMHCESLKEFKYRGKLKREFRVFGTSMKLDYAILDLHKGTNPKHRFTLLNCLSSTRRLTLCSHSCQVLESPI